MIQTFACAAVPKASVEGPGALAVQPPSPGAAFTEALAALIDDGDQTAAESAQDDARPESGVAQATITGLAGAVQVAMAMPVQSSVAVLFEGPSEDVRGDLVAPVAASNAQSVGLRSAPISAVATMTAAPATAAQTKAASPQSHAAPTPVRSGVAVNTAVMPGAVVGVKTIGVLSVRTDDIPADTNPVAAAKPETAVKPDAPVKPWTATLSEAAFVPADDSACVPVVLAAAPTEAGEPVGPTSPARRPVEQSQMPVQTAQQVATEPAGPDEPTATQPTQSRQVETVPLRVPEDPPRPAAVETTTVQWRFEPTLRRRLVEGRAEPAQDGVQPIEGRPGHGEGRGVPDNARPLSVPSVVQLAEGSTERATRWPAGKDDRVVAGGDIPDRHLPNVHAVAMGQRFGVQPAEPAARSARPEPVEELHARVIDQVVREVTLHRLGDRSDITIKLSPPELGLLRVRVSRIAADETLAGMTAHIQATSGRVRGLLEAHMPLLMDSLARAGLQMDSVSVSVGGSLTAFAGGAHHQHADPDGNGAEPATAGQQQAPSESVAASEFGRAKSSQAGYSWLA